MELPFHPLLNTSDIPPTTSLPTINAVIESHDAVLQVLNGEISNTRNVLKALEDGRVSHLRTIQQHESLRSPLRRLPVEILSAIFIICSSVAQGARSSSNLNPDNPAVALSHVCARWREIALETPLLWSRLIITPPSHPERGAFETPQDFRARNSQSQFSEHVLQWTTELERINEALLSGSPGQRTDR